MPTETKNDNFWPNDIGTSVVITPLNILSEAAAELGSKTKNLLLGEVRTSQDASGRFTHALSIVAKTMNYRYGLLSLVHDIHLYPVTGQYPGKTSQMLSDEIALRNWLKTSFASPETRKVLDALLAQARIAGKSGDVVA